MLIYTFLVVFIMRRGTSNFPVFVFCSLLPWKWLSSAMMSSADCLKGNGEILKQIYLPKFIPPMVLVVTNFVKFLFGLLILGALALAYKIPPSWHIIEMVPVTVVAALFIFSVSLVMTHLGALYMDLKNLIKHLVQLWFYLSPGFWPIELLPENLRPFWWWVNPATTIYEGYRSVFMYGTHPNYFFMGYWTVISCIIIMIMLTVIYKFDKNYTKVF
jgi:ABC-type polysaccharide/polyol phosphate export permease